MNKNQKKAFKEWIKTKGIILGIASLIVIAVYLFRWIIFVPYKLHNYLNIGHWGILLGWIIIFIGINIPVGIFNIITEADYEYIMTSEIVCAVITGMITFITYMIIYLPLMMN